MMLGECHAHLIMDGINYKAAVALHREGVREDVIRQRLQAWKEAGVSFVRDGGDAKGVSLRARELASEYGIDYRTPVFAIHKRGHYGGIVGRAFGDRKEYEELVRQVKFLGGSFIKIMVSGIMDFDCFGALSEPGLEPEEIREMIEIAHEAGFAVMVHGNGAEQVSAAVEAGADSIEHGNYLSREVLCQLAESRTVWIPTLAPTGNLRGCGRFSESSVNRILESQLQNVRQGFELGVCIGLGSDAGAYRVYHGQGLLDEYAYMKEAVQGTALDEEALVGRLTEAEERIRESF